MQIRTVTDAVEVLTTAIGQGKPLCDPKCATAIHILDKNSTRPAKNLVRPKPTNAGGRVDTTR